MNHVLYEILDYVICDLRADTMMRIIDWVVSIITRRTITLIELTQVVESILLIYRFKSLVITSSDKSSTTLEHTKRQVILFHNF